MEIEKNSDNRNLSNVPHGYSHNNVSLFHPTTYTSFGVMERHRKETFTGDLGSLNFHGQSKLDFL